MFGTLEYSAPEVYAHADEMCVDGCAADVWSLGITLYALLFGALPWAKPGEGCKDYVAFARRYKAMHPDVQIGGGGGGGGFLQVSAGASSRPLSRSVTPLPSDGIQAAVDHVGVYVCVCACTQYTCASVLCVDHVCVCACVFPMRARGRAF